MSKALSKDFSCWKHS